MLDRTVAEMKHGSIVQEKNARLAAYLWLLERQCIYDLIYGESPMRVCKAKNGVELACAPNDVDFPSEVFMAQIYLGLMAHGIEIPAQPQTEKTEQAKRVIDWKKYAKLGRRALANPDGIGSTK